MALETEELYSFLKRSGKINSDKEEFDTLLSSNDVYKNRIAKVLKFSSDAPDNLRVQTLSDFDNLISGKKKEVGEEESSQPTEQPLATTEATGQVSADTQQGSVIDSAGEPVPTEPTQTFAAPAPQNFMQDASDLKDLRSKASNLLSQSTGGGFFEEPEVVEEDVEIDDPEKPGKKKKEKQKKFSFARKNDPAVDQGPEYGVDQVLGYKDNADGTYEIVYFSENEESDYSKDYVTKAKKTANNYTGQVGDAVYNDYIKKSSSTIRNYTGNDEAWNDLNRKTVSLFHGMSAEEETKLKEEIRASNPEWDENSATALVDLALTKHQGQYNLGSIEGLMGEQEIVATADEDAPKTFMDVLRGTIKKNKKVQKEQAKNLDGKFNIIGGILGRPGEGTFFAGINKRKNRESAEQIVTRNAHVDKIDEDFFNNINVSESAQILSSIGVSPKEFLIGNQNELKRLIANSEYVQNVKLPEVDQFGNPIEYDFAKVKELEGQAKAKAADDLYNKLNEDVAYYMDLKYIEKGIETGKFKQEDLDHMKQIHDNNLAGRGFGEMDIESQADAQWAMNVRRSALNDATSFYSATAYLKTDDLKASGALRTADKDSRRLEQLNSKIANEESKLDIDKSELDINLQEIKKNNELISNFDKSIKETETELAQYADVVDNQITLKSTDGSAKAAKISEDLTKLNTEVQKISEEIKQYYDVQEDGLHLKDGVDENKAQELLDLVNQKINQLDKLEGELQPYLDKNEKGESYIKNENSDKVNEILAKQKQLIEERNKIVEASKSLGGNADKLRKFYDDHKEDYEEIAFLNSKLNTVSKDKGFADLKSIKYTIDNLDINLRENPQYSVVSGGGYSGAYSGAKIKEDEWNAYVKKSAEEDNILESTVKTIFTANKNIGEGLLQTYNVIESVFTDDSNTWDEVDANMQNTQFRKTRWSEMAVNPYLEEYSGMWWYSNAISQIPNLLYNVGASMAFGATGVITYNFLAMEGDMVKQFEDAGYDKGLAMLYGTLTAGTLASIEALVPELPDAVGITIKKNSTQIISRGLADGLSAQQISKALLANAYEVSRNAGFKILSQGTKEAGEEMASGVVESTIMNLAEIKNDTLPEAAKEVLVQGAIGALIGTGSASIATTAEVISEKTDKTAGLKFMQLEVGKNGKEILAQAEKKNADVKETDQYKDFQKVNNTYKELERVIPFKKAGDLAKAEILDLYIQKGKLVQATKEAEKLGIVDVESASKIEELDNKILAAFNADQKRRESSDVLVNSLSELGVVSYSMNQDGTVKDVNFAPEISGGVVEENLPIAKELITAQLIKAREQANKQNQEEDALQKSSTAEVLPGQPQTTGEAGGERKGVEPVLEGEGITQEGGKKEVVRDEAWDENAIANLPESSFPDRKSFKEMIKNGVYGILTAWNPQRKSLSDEENAQRNEAAKSWLEERGYSTDGAFGKYGNSELSFFVPNLSREDAIAFAIEFDQESVAAHDGLVYQDGSYHPRIKGGEKFDIQGDLYSVMNVAGKRQGFSIEYDFNTLIDKDGNKIETPNQENAQPTTEEVLNQANSTGYNVSENNRAKELAKAAKTPRQQRVVNQAVKALKTLKSILPNFNIVVFDNDADFKNYANSVGANADSRGLFTILPGEETGVIAINLESANLRTVAHEMTHAVLFKMFGDKPELYAQFKNKIADLAKGKKLIALDKDGVPFEISIDEIAADLASNEEYSDVERAEEYVSEITALLSQLKESDPANKSFLKSIAEYINQLISRYFGPDLKPIDDTSSPEEIMEFFQTFASKVYYGQEIKLDNKVAENVNTSEEVKSKYSLGGNFEATLIPESDLKKLEDEGYLVQNAKIEDLEGEVVISMFPDNKMVGDLSYGTYDKDTEVDGVKYKKGDKRVVLEGNGGLHFAIKYNEDGTFWASTPKMSKTFVNLVNKIFDKYPGKPVRVVVFKSTDLKVLSSRDGMAAAIDILELAVQDGDIPLSVFRNALNTAVKEEKDNEGIKLFSGKLSAKELHSVIKDYFVNSNDETFKKRVDVGKKIIAEIFKSNEIDFSSLSKKLNIPLNKSGKITVDAATKRLGNVQEEGFMENAPAESAVAYIEIPSKLIVEDESNIPAKERKHISYPGVMKTVDGQRVTVHMLSERKYYQDILSSVKDGNIRTSEKIENDNTPLRDLEYAANFAGARNIPYAVVRINTGVKSKAQAKSQIDDTQRTVLNEVFKQNPELKSIGTVEKYAEYLKNIFPKSLLQNIFYRGSENSDMIEAEDLDPEKGTGAKNLGKGLYWTLNKNKSADYTGGGKGRISAAILNVNNFHVVDIDANWRRGYAGLKELTVSEVTNGADAIIAYKGLDKDNYVDFKTEGENNTYIGEYVGPVDENGLPAYQKFNELTPEMDQIAVDSNKQVHILGSKKDTEGFKNFVSKSQVKSLVDDAKLTKHMTEDGQGNYLFYHYSPNKISSIDPKYFGKNTARTGRDERPGLNISMYYTRPDVLDVSGKYGYVVRIPKDLVYPFNEDPLNLYDAAKATFDKMYPGQAFDPNKQAAFIAQEAAKIGYPMTVVKWGKDLRAETTEKMKGEFYQRPDKDYPSSIEFNPALEMFQANEVVDKDIKNLPKSKAQIIGTIGAARMKNAKRLMYDLDVARVMEKEGKSKEEIRIQTNWERGADGQWKIEAPYGNLKTLVSEEGLAEIRKEYAGKIVNEAISRGKNIADYLAARIAGEIDESQDLLDIGVDKIFKGKFNSAKKPTLFRAKLTDIFDAPEIYKAYGSKEDSYQGDYGQAGKTYDYGIKDIIVEFNPEYPSGEAAILNLESGFRKPVIIVSSKDVLIPSVLTSNIIHELQHYIQMRESFENGDGPRSITNSIILRLDYLKNELTQAERDVRAADSWPSEKYVESARKKVDITKKKIDNIWNAIERANIRSGNESKNLSEANRFEYYSSSAGEAEARNAETRSKLSAEERMAKSIESTEDVAREDQLLLENYSFKSKAQIKKEDNLEYVLLLDEAANKVKKGAGILNMVNDLITKVRKIKGFRDMSAWKKREFEENIERDLKNKLAEDIATVAKIYSEMDNSSKAIAIEKAFADATRDGMEFFTVDELKDAVNAQWDKINKSELKAKRGDERPDVFKLKEKLKEAKEELTKTKEDFKQAKTAEKDKRNSFRYFVKEYLKLAKLSGLNSQQISAIVNRATGAITSLTDKQIDNFMQYVDKIVANKEFAAKMDALASNRKMALKRRHNEFTEDVLRFLSIPLYDTDNNPLLTDAEMDRYLDAVARLAKPVPDHTGLDMSLVDKAFSADLGKKEFLPADYFDLLTDIKSMPIDTLEEYTAFVRSVNKAKRILDSLYNQGLIDAATHEQWASGDLYTMENGLRVYEAGHQDQIDTFKEGLTDDLFQKISSITTNDLFVGEQKSLFERLRSLSATELMNLDVKDLLKLNEALDRMEYGFMPEKEVREMVNRVEIRSQEAGLRIVNQLGDIYKKLTKGVNLLLRKLSSEEAAQWEDVLGLKEGDALYQYVVAPIDRSFKKMSDKVNQILDSYYKKTSDLSFANRKFLFLKDRVKTANGSVNAKKYFKHRVGILSHILDSGHKAYQYNENTNDWLGNQLKEDSIERAIYDEEGILNVVEDVYNNLLSNPAFVTNGKLDYRKIYEAYINDPSSIMSESEQKLYAAFREANRTSGELIINANAVRGVNGELTEFYSPRRYIGKGMSEDSNVELGYGGAVGGTVRSQSSYSRVSKDPAGPLQFNVDALVANNAFESARDFYVSNAISYVNEVFKNAREAARSEGRDADIKTLNALQQSNRNRVDHQLSRSANNFLTKLTKSFAAKLLIGVARTAAETFTNIGSGIFRTLSLQGFNPKSYREAKNLMEKFGSPVMNLNWDFKVKVTTKKGSLTKNTFSQQLENSIASLHNLTAPLTPGEWMSYFRSEFKRLTGEDYSEAKHFDDSDYKYDLDRAASFADQRIQSIKGGSFKGQARTNYKWLPDLFSVPKMALTGKGNKSDVSRGLVSSNDTVAQMLNLFNNFVFRDVSNLLYGAKRAGRGITKDDRMNKGADLGRGLFKVATSATSLTMYTVIFAAVKGIEKAYFSDDDKEKKKGEEALEMFTNPDKMWKMIASMGINLAANVTTSRYGASGRAMAISLLQFARNMKGAEKQPIDEVLQSLYFTEGIDFEKYDAVEKYAALAFATSVPPIYMLMQEAQKLYKDYLDEPGHNKATIYDLWEEGGKLFNEETADLNKMLSATIMATNLILAMDGKQIPFSRDFIKSLQDETAIQQDVVILSSDGKYNLVAGVLNFDQNGNGVLSVQDNSKFVSAEKKKERSEALTQEATSMFKNYIQDELKNNRYALKDRNDEGKYAVIKFLAEKAKFDAKKKMKYDVDPADYPKLNFENLTFFEDVASGKFFEGFSKEEYDQEVSDYITKSIETDSDYSKYEASEAGGQQALERYYYDLYQYNKKLTNVKPIKTNYFKIIDNKIESK